MSIYTLRHGVSLPAAPPVMDLLLTERSIYGSSRLGVENINQIIASGNPDHVNINISPVQIIGDKNYELSNHLGNVLEVVTDRKLAVDQGEYNPITATYSSATPDGLVDYYIADVVSQSDYFPFGQLLPGRNEHEEDHRYAFNGMEKDDEVSGSNNSYDFGARMYNPRVGRFLSRDPDENMYAFMSPYVFAGNNPINLIDENGRGPKPKLVNGDRTPFTLNEIQTLIISKGGIPGPERSGDMVPSLAAVMTIVSFESLSLHLYDNDGAKNGNSTIGFGHMLHTGPINAADKALYDKGITKGQAVDFLLEDIASKTGTVNNLIRNRGLQGELTQGQFDAAFDLYFNGGTKVTGKYLDKLAEIKAFEADGEQEKAEKHKEKLDDWLLKQYPGKDKKRGIARMLMNQGDSGDSQKSNILNEVEVKAE